MSNLVHVVCPECDAVNRVPRDRLGAGAKCGNGKQGGGNVRVRLQGQAAQIAFGRRIAAHLRSPCTIYLQGDLGTGKTTLVRGILRGLGHAGPVRSPTYTLLEPYELGAMGLYHLDLYRLGDPEELEYLGLRDLLDGRSLLLVEWPERGRGALPAPDLTIRIEHAGEARSLELTAHGPCGRVLEAHLCGIG